jgi:hypothetical protein
MNLQNRRVSQRFTHVWRAFLHTASDDHAVVVGVTTGRRAPGRPAVLDGLAFVRAVGSVLDEGLAVAASPASTEFGVKLLQ